MPCVHIKGMRRRRRKKKHVKYETTTTREKKEQKYTCTRESLHKCFIRHIRLELATLILKQSTTYYHTNMHQFLFHFVGMAVIKQSTQLIAEHLSANKCQNHKVNRIYSCFHMRFSKQLHMMNILCCFHSMQALMHHFITVYQHLTPDLY